MGQNKLVDAQLIYGTTLAVRWYASFFDNDRYGAVVNGATMQSLTEAPLKHIT